VSAGPGAGRHSLGGDSPRHPTRRSHLVKRPTGRRHHPRRSQTGCHRAPRRHLSAAREIFNQLGATPWVARASSELRDRSVSRSRPAPGPGHANSATARDRGTRGSWPDEQADRRAAVPVAPHGRHKPVPDLPETRRHFEGGTTTRRIVQQRGSRGDGPIALTLRLKG
jgi:hypothetical protein